MAFCAPGGNNDTDGLRDVTGRWGVAECERVESWRKYRPFVVVAHELESILCNETNPHWIGILQKRIQTMQPQH